MSTRACYPSLQLTNLQQAARIRKWFAHIRDAKPTVMTTYNGDSFDFPFVEVRAMIHGIDVYTETGFKRGQSARAVPTWTVSCKLAQKKTARDWLTWSSKSRQAGCVSPSRQSMSTGRHTAKLGYDPIE